MVGVIFGRARVGRFIQFVALGCLVTAIGCQAIKDVMALSGALQAEYHLPANVNIGGGHLAITFQNVDPSLKLDSTGRADFARNVATFAKTHYAEAASLTDIRVTFATQSTSGPLTITKTDASFVFQAADLK
jgi:hypothetical protein